MLPRLFAKERLNKFHGTPSQKKNSWYANLIDEGPRPQISH